MALIWHGKKVTKAIHADARAKVLKAILLMEADVKMSMRKGGRTESGAVEGKGKNRKDPMTGKRPEKIGTYRSKGGEGSESGEVPRVQTGTLRRSITHEMHKALPIGRVGTNVVYSKWLEFGTRRMKPRPFMRPSILRIMPALKGIFATPVKGGFMP